MSLFNFFKSKKEKECYAPFAEQTPIMENNSTQNHTLTVSCVTGWPIDLIYGYLHKNYEEKGYADALLNSNITFRDKNTMIIKNKILICFREVKLKYQAMKQDIETRIDTCRAAGLLTTVAELEKQMSIITTHTNELITLETDFRSNENEVSTPITSYECGFLRGISAIALSTSTQTHHLSSDIQMPVFLNPERETA